MIIDDTSISGGFLGGTLLAGVEWTPHPWKITMLLIGKTSISMGHFPWLC
jgi:hypothetical protein